MTWPALVVVFLAVVLALFVGMLVGVVLAAIGQQSGRERAERKLAEDGVAMLRGKAFAQRVDASTPTMSSTWHPGASTH